MKIINDKKQILYYQKKIIENKMISSSHLSQMQLARYNKSEYLYHQEDELEYMYILVSGKVKVSYSSSNGKETIFRIIDKPRIIGEMELILDKLAFTEVEALEDTICMLLPSKICYESIMKDVEFLKHCCFNMAEALSLSNNQFANNQNFTPKTRVISYILSVQSNMFFQFDFKMISNIIGISERHVFRIISILLDEKLIEKHQKKFKIVDIEKLKELAGDLYFFHK